MQQEDPLGSYATDRFALRFPGDKLASEGVRFNNYNVEVQCTPTRSVTMTGPMPVRSETYSVPAPGQGLLGLAPWQYTIAELLSNAGYATALYGKWHLGDTQGQLPNDQAYDESSPSSATPRRTSRSSSTWATPSGLCR